MIANAHIVDRGNVGDWSCAPCDYFSFGRPVERVNILHTGPRQTGVTIVGGGGLLHERCPTEAFVTASSATLVGWGFGLNRHGASADEYPAYLDRFALLGMRDATAPRWVPCVSCMHPAFDREYRVERAVVAYRHWKYPTPPGPPTLSNRVASVEEAVAFLGSAETVVTTSYHGAYWATLLGRRAVVYQPFASRFHHLRHPPALATPEDWEEKARTARRHPDALRECRAANVAFYHDVMDLIDRVADGPPDFT